VVLHNEAAWNLKEYLSHADVLVYMGEQDWERRKWEQAWEQRRAQQS
jgi:hypothetical protein